MRNARCVQLILLLLLVPGSVDAQEATVTVAAPIYLLPDSSRVPLRTAAANTRLRVLEDAPEGWLKVEFRDPQFGPRIGYIEARFVRIHRPELEPMDLSVTSDRFVAPPGGVAQSPGAPAREREPAPQRTPARRGFSRAWIDVNVGAAIAGEPKYGSVFERQSFGELARFSADYHWPAGASLDVGGGVMLTPVFGLGLSFMGTAHQDRAQLGVNIPHPVWPDTYASDTAPTDGKLTRAEGSAHIQAMFAAPLSDAVVARVFGGPSYFRIRQDVVSDIIYLQDFIVLLPVHEVDILRYDTDRIEFDTAGGWGFHVGGDIGFFVTRHVGLGVFAKYSRGRIEVFDPFSEADRRFTTGGFQAGGGLRRRF